MKTTKRLTLAKRIEKLTVSKELNKTSLELEMVLRKLGIEFQTGNDAVRGDKTGCYVKITIKMIE